MAPQSCATAGAMPKITMEAVTRTNVRMTSPPLDTPWELRHHSAGMRAASGALLEKISAACEPLLRTLDAGLILPGVFSRLPDLVPLHPSGKATPRLALGVPEPVEQRRLQ